MKYKEEKREKERMKVIIFTIHYSHSLLTLFFRIEKK